MFKFIKDTILFIKFVKYANSVGFNLNNPTPVESLAFQTVTAVLLSPKKDLSLKRNKLTTFDSIIFTLFVVRMLCITQISNRTKAEEFSNMYINKVFEYFPEGKDISKKYDSDFFTERVKYYDSIFMDDSYSFDERMNNIVEAFESVITYDYVGKYIRFDENTPIMIIDIFEKIKISTDIKSYYNSFDSFFFRLFPDICKAYS